MLCEPGPVPNWSGEPPKLTAVKDELVSVVIPCYNQAHFLGEAIESVLAQTYRCFEVIVVDDGSRDEVDAVSARFPGITYFRQPNQGVSGARNAGLKVSRGAYVVFLDADDRLLPEALSIGVENLKSHPDCAFVWGQCRHSNKAGEPIPAPPKPWIKQEHYVNLLRTNYIRTPGVVMYRRAVFDAVGGFDPELQGGEDYDLHLRIAREFPVHGHNRVVLVYRVHQSSAMHSSARIFQDTMKALKRQRRFVKRNQLRREAYASGMKAWRQLFGERLWIELRERLKHPGANWRSVIQCLWTLARFDPKGLLQRTVVSLRRATLKPKSYETIGSDTSS